MLRPDSQHEIQWVGLEAKCTASSVYRLLVEGVSCENTQLNNIWKLNIPLKMHIFLWLMLKDKILSLHNLMKRGWQLANVCILCRDNAETVKHLFNGCTYFSRALLYTQTLQNMIDEKGWDLIIQATDQTMVVEQRVSEKARELLAFLFSAVRKERCHGIFRNREMDCQILVQQIIQDWRQYAESNTS